MKITYFRRFSVSRGSKMRSNLHPNCSLEGSGRPLGADSVSRGSPEPSWRGSGAARGSQKIRCWLLGVLLGRKVGGFQASGGSPAGRRRVPGRLREAILEAFLQKSLAARKKVMNLSDFLYFWHSF